MSSPLFYVDANDPPTFVVHRGADQRVPFEQPELLIGAREAGVLCFLVLPGTDHAGEFVWWGSFSSQLTRQGLEEFLDRPL